MPAKVRYTISNIQALNTLLPREKVVLEMRLGIGEFIKQYTRKEIAEYLGLYTTERVRQIEDKALRKLRHPNRNCEVIYI